METYENYNRWVWKIWYPISKLFKIIKNHDVTIIDNREEAFNNLGGNFTGRTVLGMGYDKDVLESAGIKVADALISCSSSDAINAVVSNIAHNIYHVNNVIARMYDKSKARIFVQWEFIQFQLLIWVLKGS